MVGLMVLVSGVSFVIGVLFGLELVEPVVMADCIIECNSHFDELIQNATDGCVEQVKADVDWDGIMAECEKCEYD